MSEDFVLAKLRALKEADAGMEANPEVEARLIHSFKGTFQRRKTVRVWRRSAAVVAVGVAAGVMGLLAIRRTPPPAAIEVPPPAVAVVETTPAPAEKPAPVPVRRPAKRKAKVKDEAPPPEIATEFFPLMDMPPPFERGELLRVVVPAATMRTVGLPVMDNHLNDPVQADILVGQEGLARAIRFVNYQH